jgi:acetyl esterase/lipase
LKKGQLGHHGLTNSLISPCIMPEEMLKSFPPTYINVGTLDPLFDDSIVLAKRLDKATQTVKVDIYDGLGHGYLNMLDMVEDAKIANSRLCGWINEFLKK